MYNGWWTARSHVNEMGIKQWSDLITLLAAQLLHWYMVVATLWLTTLVSGVIRQVSLHHSVFMYQQPIVFVCSYSHKLDCTAEQQNNIKCSTQQSSSTLDFADNVGPLHIEARPTMMTLNDLQWLIWSYGWNLLACGLSGHFWTVSLIHGLHLGEVPSLTGSNVPAKFVCLIKIMTKYCNRFLLVTLKSHLTIFVVMYQVTF